MYLSTHPESWHNCLELVDFCSAVSWYNFDKNVSGRKGFCRLKLAAVWESKMLKANFQSSIIKRLELDY